MVKLTTAEVQHETEIVKYNRALLELEITKHQHEIFKIVAAQDASGSVLTSLNGVDDSWANVFSVGLQHSKSAMEAGQLLGVIFGVSSGAVLMYSSFDPTGEDDVVNDSIIL